jgi:ubiquinone/menaquinone biosynthesis C-methylase UbiE
LHTNFDLVANSYPLLEHIVYSSALDQARTSFVERIDRGKKLLLIGEGNGRFLAEILAQKRTDSITVVDASAKMLAATKQRIRNSEGRERIQWVHADFLKWRLPIDRFDGVITHFFLDLFEPPKISLICQKIAQLTAREGFWIDVDFMSGPGDLRYKSLMWAQYRFFRILAGIEAARLHDPLTLIQEAGWRILEEKRYSSNSVCARLMDHRS